MKVLPWLLLFACGLVTPLAAQTTTGKPMTSTTPVNSATVVSNRQQERYDQYHGYNKKTNNTTSEPKTPASPVLKPVANQPSVVEAITPPAPNNRKRRRAEPNDRLAEQPAVTTRIDVSQESSNAEVRPLSRFRIGVRGGITYPYYLDKSPVVDPVAGFVGGITFTLGTGTVSFQPEVNYVRNSAKMSGLGVIPTYASDMVQVPLLVKFATGSYASNRFFIHVGPYASYETSASIDGKKYALTSTSNRLGFGAMLGIGTALKAGPGHVTLEIRGLYPLTDTNNGTINESRTIFGQATIGYMFPLGGSR